LPGVEALLRNILGEHRARAFVFKKLLPLIHWLLSVVRLVISHFANTLKPNRWFLKEKTPVMFISPEVAIVIINHLLAKMNSCEARPPVRAWFVQQLHEILFLFIIIF
jgi:hypothetical protein